MKYPFLAVSKARTTILWVTAIPLVLVLTLFVLATLQGNKFEGIEMTVWAWFGAVVLPLCLLAVLSAFQNTNAGLFTTKTVFRALLIAVVLYSMVVLYVSVTYGTGKVDGGIAAHFKKSYIYLLPFNAILVLLFSLLFFKKESILIPKQSILETEGKAVMELARQQSNLPMQLAIEDLQNADYKAVFEKMSAAFAGDDLLESERDQVILLQNRYNQLQKNLTMGLISKENSTLSINEITYASLQLIKKIKP